MLSNEFRKGKKWNPESQETPDDGTIREIDSIKYIYFDRCWILYYEPPTDTVANRKALITHLTKRTFHNTESGINTPGYRLQEARSAYEAETNLKRKRVNAAMLAGALFNRATDIFTAIAEFGSQGIVVTRSNELMKECSGFFKEALELGKSVKDFSGEEGIDELWGEPFRAFTVSPAQFYSSRYIKISQTWHNIDTITATMFQCISSHPEYKALHPLLSNFAIAAKCESETMKSDPLIFNIWPEFVSSGEALEEFRHKINPSDSLEHQFLLKEGLSLVWRGKKLITWIAAARVPMPQSTKCFEQACIVFTDKLTRLKK